ncbi:hypothetical protein ACFX13_006735 [Malus domestica]|uniref:uncharacterized protein LOC126591045 n=1 Tax=Malus sylvestris TaxID=3752 RepID=UPI0021ABF29E|nr:uncharacterized protein LOC126591045 [Malus sylvestris]
MDYNLAALKLLCVQLKDATEDTKNAMELHGIAFQRAWLQGILVHVFDDGERLLLDDGTGVIELSLRPELRHRTWKIGMYVMTVGRYTLRKNEPPMIQVHKMVDLSDSHDREAMWYLEVMEAYNLFYRRLMEG